MKNQLNNRQLIIKALKLAICLPMAIFILALTFLGDLMAFEEYLVTGRKKEKTGDGP